MLAAAGVAADAIRFRYGVDARYLGQGNEITDLGRRGHGPMPSGRSTYDAGRASCSRPTTGASTASRSPTSASRPSRGGCRRTPTAPPVEPQIDGGARHRRRVHARGPVRFARGADPSTRRSTADPTSASASRSTARRSSRSARPPRSSVPAGSPASPPTDRWSPTQQHERIATMTEHDDDARRRSIRSSSRCCGRA